MSNHDPLHDIDQDDPVEEYPCPDCGQQQGHDDNCVMNAQWAEVEPGIWKSPQITGFLRETPDGWVSFQDDGSAKRWRAPTREELQDQIRGIAAVQAGQARAEDFKLWLRDQFDVEIPMPKSDRVLKLRVYDFSTDRPTIAGLMTDLDCLVLGMVPEPIKIRGTEFTGIKWGPQKQDSAGNWSVEFTYEGRSDERDERSHRDADEYFPELDGLTETEDGDLPLLAAGDKFEVHVTHAGAGRARVWGPRKEIERLFALNPKTCTVGGATYSGLCWETPIAGEHYGMYLRFTE
jgi:hypothetical protein